MGGEVERKERRTSSIGQRAWHSPSPRAKKTRAKTGIQWHKKARGKRQSQELAKRQKFKRRVD